MSLGRNVLCSDCYVSELLIKPNFSSTYRHVLAAGLFKYQDTETLETMYTVGILGLNSNLESKQLNRFKISSNPSTLPKIYGVDYVEAKFGASVLISEDRTCIEFA